MSRFSGLLLLSLFAPLYAPAADLARLPVLENASNPDSAKPARFSHFHLNRSRDLEALKPAIEDLLTLAKAQKKAKKDREEKHPDQRINFPLEIKGGQRMAFERVLELYPAMQRGEEKALFEAQQLLAAFSNSHEYPIKHSYQIPELPYYIVKGMKHAVVRARGGDNSAEPKPSSYWQPVANDGTVDLAAGFGRSSLNDADSEVCEYTEPKTSWGAHPGFRMLCKGEKLKFKLGDEIYSGPVATRLFWLMGYNVEPIDSAKQLRIRYDRRVLSEFNSRKHLEFDVRFLFIPVYRHVITNYEDPFKFIAYGQLKDGTKIPGAELKKRLLKVIPAGDPTKPDYPRPEKMARNFREELERQIDFLAFVPGTVAADSDDIKSIGPWKYDQFDTANRREVRAIQILSAWVGNYNMRWENTTLAWIKQADGRWALRHQLSDVGSGLGNTFDLRNLTNSQVAKFSPRVTTALSDGSVKLSGFMQNTPNAALDNMSLEDAQWMLRKMARVSAKQIEQAVGATSMPPTMKKEAFTKLWNRRAWMVRDFGLAKEFPEAAKVLN